MRRTTLLAALSVVLPVLSGCAAIDADVRARLCNEGGAYEEGFNAGRAGQEMGAHWVGTCDARDRPAVHGAYREGYLAGTAMRLAETVTSPAPAP